VGEGYINGLFDVTERLEVVCIKTLGDQQLTHILVGGVA